MGSPRLHEIVLARVARLVASERRIVDGVVDDDLDLVRHDADELERLRMKLRLRRDRQPIDRAGRHARAVRFHVHAKSSFVQRGGERLVVLQRRLATGHDDHPRCVAIERDELLDDLAGFTLGRALGGEVGIAPRAREIARRESQEHARAPRVRALALQRRTEQLLDEIRQRLML
jgi:hypothetical protein